MPATSRTGARRAAGRPSAGVGGQDAGRPRTSRAARDRRRSCRSDGGAASNSKRLEQRRREAAHARPARDQLGAASTASVAGRGPPPRRRSRRNAAQPTAASTASEASAPAPRAGSRRGRPGRGAEVDGRLRARRRRRPPSTSRSALRDRLPMSLSNISRAASVSSASSSQRRRRGGGPPAARRGREVLGVIAGPRRRGRRTRPGGPPPRGSARSPSARTARSRSRAAARFAAAGEPGAPAARRGATGRHWSTDEQPRGQPARAVVPRPGLACRARRGRARRPIRPSTARLGRMIRRRRKLLDERRTMASQVGAPRPVARRHRRPADAPSRRPKLGGRGASARRGARAGSGRGARGRGTPPARAPSCRGDEGEHRRGRVLAGLDGAPGVAEVGSSWTAKPSRSPGGAWRRYMARSSEQGT